MPDAPPPSKDPKTHVRRSRADEHLIVWGKNLLTQLTKNAAKFDAGDAHMDEPRCGPKFRDTLSNTITVAQSAIDGQTVRLETLHAQTVRERGTAQELADKLLHIRGRASTLADGSPAFKKVFGAGSDIRSSHTGTLILLAGNFATAFADPEFHDSAVAAGITQSMIDEVTQLAQQLSSADIGQHGRLEVRKDGTISKAAALKYLQSQLKYALSVAQNLFGKASSIYLAMTNKAPRVRARPKKPASSDASAAPAPTPKKRAAAKPGARGRKLHAKVVDAAVQKLRAASSGGSAKKGSVKKASRAKSGRKTAKKGSKRTKRK